MFNDFNEVVEQYYERDCERVFILAMEFEAYTNLTESDAGPAPANFKDPNKITKWKQDKLDEMSESPESNLLAGEPKCVTVAASNGDVLITDPKTALVFLGEVLSRGALVVGKDAPSRLRALAVWGRIAEGIASPVDVWRTSGVRRYSLRSMVIDPLDFLLTSSSGISDRYRFSEALQLGKLKGVSGEIADAVKILGFIQPSLDEVYRSEED